MKMIKIYSILLILLSVSFMQSCTEDFEEMNKDPLNPTEGSIPTVFNKYVSSLLYAGAEISGFHNGYYYYMTQQLGNAAPRYVLANLSNQMWTDYYKALKNARWLENELDNSTLKVDNVRACLNILIAFETLRTSDYYGDMPFSKAGKGSQGSEYFRVEYDKHEDIYKTCLDMLKNAVESFSSDPDQMSLGGGDILFSGDYEMWKKFANSIRLRYALQISGVDNAQATTHIGNILGDAAKYPLISGDEDLGFWPTRVPGLTIETRNWSLNQDSPLCLGTTMWSWMSENDNVDGSGIIDPRCKVFFETNNDGEWKAQKQLDPVDSQGRGAYNGGAYPSGRSEAATLQEWENKTEGCKFSPVNIYYANDKEFFPELFISVAEINFIKAEIYNRGIGVTKNAATAKSEYEAGIRSSINYWYNLVELKASKWYLFKPELGEDDIDDYLALPVVAYKTNESEALEQIYAQEWIALFREPAVAYNLYRRTEATPHDRSSSSHENNFYRLPYPEEEKNFNADNFNAALNGRSNTVDHKLFWHK
ncbi:SusD/RagB family nutrient-binding outer membrane lipoprotein [Puteibacter caeruleilacunae]|nr:SusD/RagB family nutrient-binding outer membrane lipoprotein [Puteibacter caeruleilacunae]